MRIREQLERERVAERSVELASGQIFAMACGAGGSGSGRVEPEIFLRCCG